MSHQSPEEEPELLKLQAEVDCIFNRVGSDGLTGNDRAILRGQLPIPEEYGTYTPSPTEIKKIVPIKWVPEESIFVVDEERLEGREIDDLLDELNNRKTTED